MKKILSIFLAITMCLSMVACSSTTDKSEGDTSKKEETVTISVTDADGKPIDVDFPKMPEKVAVLNYQTLDFLDAMGLGDRIAGMVKGSAPEHLKKYEEDESIVNLGGMKDIDIEALAALKPDVIFSSDRTQAKYNEFSEIAPTMAAYIDYKKGFLTSYKELAQKHATIFDVNADLDEKLADYDKRISEINKKYNGKTAVLGIFASGFNALGSNGRASIVVNELGFVNQTKDDVNHGNKLSYEGLLDINPEYIFILDKDTAVGEDAVEAKQQMENDIVKQTDAYKNDKIIYLEPGDAWYMCDGGITALDLMLSNLEESLGMQSK